MGLNSHRGGCAQFKEDWARSLLSLCDKGRWGFEGVEGVSTALRHSRSLTQEDTVFTVFLLCDLIVFNVVILSHRIKGKSWSNVALSFSRESWGPETGSDLPKVTQQASGRAHPEPQRLSCEQGTADCHTYICSSPWLKTSPDPLGREETQIHFKLADVAIPLISTVRYVLFFLLFSPTTHLPCVTEVLVIEISTKIPHKPRKFIETSEHLRGFLKDFIWSFF